MSRNGSGTYSLPAGNPVVQSTTITSSWANTTLQNIADGLTQSVASDGQTPMSGALNMATNDINNVGTLTALTGTTTNKLTIGDTQLGAGNASIMKNRIINGAMVIDQRNAGASITPTASGQYTLDRFNASISVASKFSVQQNAGSVTPPVGFSNYLGVTSLAAYAVLTGDYFAIGQAIEGYNVADFGWGTANAKTVTLSCQVYSSLTGTFGGSLKNSTGERSYPFTYSIPVANTWTTISVTIAGDTGGSWGATNNAGVIITFGLGVGSTYSGTAGVWGTSDYLSATGATSVVGTSGATFYITGAQLEVGSSATGFEYRNYGTELNMCQRYYEKSSDYSVIYRSSGTAGQWVGVNINATDFYDFGRNQFRVTKRAAPTVNLWSPLNGIVGQFYNIGTESNTGNSGARYIGMNGCSFYSPNNAMAPALSATATHWYAEAEL